MTRDRKRRRIIARPRIPGRALRSQTTSYLDHEAGFWSRAADQDVARFRHVQRIFEVFDLALGQFGDASVADTRPAAVVGVQALPLGQIQDAVARWVPADGQARTREFDMDPAGEFRFRRRHLSLTGAFSVALQDRTGAEELVMDPRLGNT